MELGKGRCKVQSLQEGTFPSIEATPRHGGLPPSAGLLNRVFGHLESSAITSGRRGLSQTSSYLLIPGVTTIGAQLNFQLSPIISALAANHSVQPLHGLFLPQ